MRNWHLGCIIAFIPFVMLGIGVALSHLPPFWTTALALAVLALLIVWLIPWDKLFTKPLPQEKDTDYDSN